MNEFQPTPYPDVNTLLEQVLNSAQAVLGSHFIGMYLEGSLASGAFDQDSDIDFLVVTDEDVRGSLFDALQAMHDRLSTLDTPWAIQLEGIYISQQALRRHDPAHTMHPDIERGLGERLKMVNFDQGLDIHRWMLRERGITLAGPHPKELIDPISPEQLRQVMRASAPNWMNRILADPTILKARGYQTYVVLTLCRILYTMQTGQVVSKPEAARWAAEELDQRWRPLIERTWSGRHNPEAEAAPDEVSETQAMIRFTLEQIEQDHSR